MTEETGIFAFIRRKLAEFGWLRQDVIIGSEPPSSWDAQPAYWLPDLRQSLHQFVKSFVQWIHAHAWRKRSQDDHAISSADLLLPGFIETAQARARLEFDDQRQVWIACLDFTHHSFACHLEMVNEASPPIMKHILLARQTEDPPAE